MIICTFQLIEINELKINCFYMYVSENDIDKFLAYLRGSFPHMSITPKLHIIIYGRSCLSLPQKVAHGPWFLRGTRHRGHTQRFQQTDIPLPASVGARCPTATADSEPSRQDKSKARPESASF